MLTRGKIRLKICVTPNSQNRCPHMMRTSRVSGVMSLCQPMCNDLRVWHTHLLARPERFGLEDCRHGNLAVPVLQPHQDIHEEVLPDEGVALCNQTAAQQRVLHDADDRLVGLQELDRDDI